MYEWHAPVALRRYTLNCSVLASDSCCHACTVLTQLEPTANTRTSMLPGILHGNTGMPFCRGERSSSASLMTLQTLSSRKSCVLRTPWHNTLPPSCWTLWTPLLPRHLLQCMGAIWAQAQASLFRKQCLSTAGFAGKCSLCRTGSTSAPAGTGTVCIGAMDLKRSLCSSIATRRRGESRMSMCLQKTCRCGQVQSDVIPRHACTCTSSPAAAVLVFQVRGSVFYLWSTTTMRCAVMMARPRARA
jgi:hypothetical protein